MADTNRNQWEDRFPGNWDNRSNQQDRSRDDYSNNYGSSYGSRYSGEDYRSDSPYRNDYSGSQQRRNERRDDYTNLDSRSDRSTNMGSGYDPYHYGQTVGSFNQGKEGSYDSRFNYQGYRNINNMNEGTGYDSDYNRRYGRNDAPPYNRGSYAERNASQYQQRDQRLSDWDRDRTGYSNKRNDRDWWDRATDEVASWFGDDDAERRREVDKRMGPHRGKGPKGYTRSDERIKDDVNDRLSDDSFVDASEIDVTCEGCEVVLTGTVDTKEEKRRAEDIAERISGVRNVENRLKVRGRDNSGGATIYRDRD